MEGGCSSQRSRRVDKGDKETRRIWSKREEEVLLDGFRELLNKGWKLEKGQFKTGYIDHLEKYMLTRFPDSDLRATPHIESKIKIWKKNYFSITNALHKGSGIGWNDTRKTLKITQEDVWQNYLKKDKNAKNIRNKTFPYYDQWNLIFRKDRDTGEMTGGLGDAAENRNCLESGTNDNNLIPELIGFDDIDSRSATQTSIDKNDKKQRGRKRMRKIDMMVSAITDMAMAFRNYCESMEAQIDKLVSRIGYEQDLAEARKQVNGELTKITNLSLEERLRAGMIIINDPPKVDFLFSLPDHEKEPWVHLLLSM